MLSLFSAVLIGSLEAQAAPEGCYVKKPCQDLNCNGICVEDELALPKDDPDCLAAYDTRPNADYYWDIKSYGCKYPVDFLDYDDKSGKMLGPPGDGYSAGRLQSPPDTKFPDVLVILSCDNCPDTYNPSQADLDCDGIGDECDVCPADFDPLQLDGDGDKVGDLCDNCVAEVNTDQSDQDVDNIGDLCDNCISIINPFQTDGDEDDAGDECDNCVYIPNSTQEDNDNDGRAMPATTVPA